jgi:hypothetical protein
MVYLFCRKEIDTEETASTTVSIQTDATLRRGLVWGLGLGLRV